MSKPLWYLMLVPILCWAVHMCWLAGYRNGYQAGHDDGWDSARRVMIPDRQLAELEPPGVVPLRGLTSDPVAR